MVIIDHNVGNSIHANFRTIQIRDRDGLGYGDIEICNNADDVADDSKSAALP